MQLALQGMNPKILELEATLKTYPPSVGLPVKHHYIEGVYVRELFIPKGTVLVGKIHNKENVSILSQGELMVVNEKGTFSLKAPHTMVDPPGVKRAGYAVTDCTFINIFRSDKITVEDLEAELASDTFEEYEQKRLSL